MVLHVASDARKVVDDRHPHGLQRIRRTDPRKLKQARRTDRAAADDHLAIRAQRFGAASLGDRDPDGAALVDLDLQRLRVQAHHQVLPCLTGFRNALDVEDLPALRVES